jgi:hypothetical protein
VEEVEVDVERRKDEFNEELRNDELEEIGR